MWIGGRRGFTILEVLLSGLIAGIIFFSIPAVFKLLLAEVGLVNKRIECSTFDLEAALRSVRPYLKSVDAPTSEVVELVFYDDCRVHLLWSPPEKKLRIRSFGCKEKYLPPTVLKADKFEAKKRGDGVEIYYRCENRENLVYVASM